MARRKRSSIKGKLLLGAGVAGVAGFAAAYRFALRYRERAGYPTRNAVEGSPADFGLEFESVRITSAAGSLAAWFVPATPAIPLTPAPEPERTPERTAGPAVVVVHGWESNRGRTFAHVRYLHAAGFHCLVFDVRGHGDSPTDDLPVNVPEFAEDTVAAVRWLARRSEVESVGVLGHSMGGAGAIVAAAREPLIQAVVSVSAPADIVLITRKTFEMAEMNIPEPIATPLAWFTAALLLAPRRHGLHEASATVAAARYRGPLLLIHGAQDHGVPVSHLEMIARAAARQRDEVDPEVETLVLPDFGHRWLYEDAGCRRKTAAFFAEALGGLHPDVAGRRAADVEVKRPDDPVYGFGGLAGQTATDPAGS
jgi:pimeloyl-ACP methyl ester carboxylesterase